MPAEAGKPRKPNEASRNYTIRKPKRKSPTAADILREEAEEATSLQRRLKQEFMERQKRRSK